MLLILEEAGERAGGEDEGGKGVPDAELALGSSHHPHARAWSEAVPRVQAKDIL